VFNTRVIAYVHYPTISSDMLEKVASRRSDYNNSSRVASSPTLSFIKLVYYRVFAWGYGLAGSCTDEIMVICSRGLTPGQFNVDKKTY
jgi:alpha-1,2-mannosyltransferase